MNVRHALTHQASPFIILHLPDFLDKFGITYSNNSTQLEYYIYSKKTGLNISCSLTLSYDEALGQINIETFYPRLHVYPETRFFSAVCFYLIIQHFANFHQIKYDCCISLNTNKIIFKTFYRLLKDFDFSIKYSGRDGHVNIVSHFSTSKIDTSVIHKCV